MPHGTAFKDEYRIVLMLIKEQHSTLKWREVKQVFNIIFPGEDRTAVALRQQWLHRNNEKKAEWDAARHELSQKDEDDRTHQITSAVGRAGVISNANAAQVETEGETEGETGDEIEDEPEDETGDEADTPPAKRQKLNNSDSTASEDLQETLQRPETDTEREIVAAAQGQVDEQEAPDAPGEGTTYNEDEGGDEATYAPEAASVQHAAPGGVGEATHSPTTANVQHTASEGGRRGVPSRENRSALPWERGGYACIRGNYVLPTLFSSAGSPQGEWQFVSEEDARQAFTSIGGYGVSHYPSAAEVHQWRSMQEARGNSTLLADGINIVWVPGNLYPGT